MPAHVRSAISIPRADPLYSHSILDCVNNVACVGHSHPRVARAAAQQLLRVNTNTRYLCPVRVSYARKLLATFGEEGEAGGRLSTVFFVNSGSEANVSHQFSDPSRTEDAEPDPCLAASQDLALRMARAFTKSQEVIVLDSAYHGHTAALIDVSPYKYEGKGGFPRPQHTHQATAPDVYRCSNKADKLESFRTRVDRRPSCVDSWRRGRYGAHDAEAGPKYAEDVRAICEGLQQEGKRPAAFICESVLGCGGQVVLPKGYLEASYAHVRAHGGVCIADEVQVRRVGSARLTEHLVSEESTPRVVLCCAPGGSGGLRSRGELLLGLRDARWVCSALRGVLP